MEGYQEQFLGLSRTIFCILYVLKRDIARTIFRILLAGTEIVLVKSKIFSW